MGCMVIELFIEELGRREIAISAGCKFQNLPGGLRWSFSNELVNADLIDEPLHIVAPQHP